MFKSYSKNTWLPWIKRIFMRRINMNIWAKRHLDKGTLRDLSYVCCMIPTAASFCLRRLRLLCQVLTIYHEGTVHKRYFNFLKIKNVEKFSLMDFFANLHAGHTRSSIDQNPRRWNKTNNQVVFRTCSIYGWPLKEFVKYNWLFINK